MTVSFLSDAQTWTQSQPVGWLWNCLLTRRFKARQKVLFLQRPAARKLLVSSYTLWSPVTYKVEFALTCEDKHWLDLGGGWDSDTDIYSWLHTYLPQSWGSLKKHTALTINRDPKHAPLHTHIYQLRVSQWYYAKLSIWRLLDSKLP